MKASLLALAAAAMQAAAECPNACSNKGDCGVHDQCTCYAGYSGADCSQRLCPVGNAFVDTPRGDLNHDGYLNAVGASNTRYSTVSWSRYKQYEYWPTVSGDSAGYFPVSAYTGDNYDINPADLAGTGWAARAGEAHFRTECSGKGVCDRDNGVCQCYDGFSGSACQRTACPNDCSGHGLCRTVSEIAENGLNKRFVDSVGGINTYAGVLNPFTYRLWDAEKNRACVCDYGYTGPDCSMRECPRGDDPLTTTAKNCGGATCRKEVQTFILQSQATTVTYRIKFNDFSGNYFYTDNIQFKPTGVVADTTSRDFTTDKIAAALEALPNGIAGSVTVSATPIGMGTTTKTHVLYKVTFDSLPGNVPELEVLLGDSGVAGSAVLAQPSEPIQAVEFATATSALVDTGVFTVRVFPTDLTGLSATEVASSYTITGCSACSVSAGTSTADAANVVTQIKTAFDKVTALKYYHGEVAATPSAHWPVDAVLDYSATGDVVYLVMPSKRFGANVVTFSQSTTFDPPYLVSVDGNQEYSMCSNRGLCDYSAGLCKCFPGYAGNACNTQSALAM